MLCEDLMDIEDWLVDFLDSSPVVSWSSEGLELTLESGDDLVRMERTKPQLTASLEGTRWISSLVNDVGSTDATTVLTIADGVATYEFPCGTTRAEVVEMGFDIITVGSATRPEGCVGAADATTNRILEHFIGRTRFELSSDDTGTTYLQLNTKPEPIVLTAGPIVPSMNLGTTTSE
jgi:hypothetical protein